MSKQKSSVPPPIPKKDQLVASPTVQIEAEPAPLEDDDINPFEVAKPQIQ